MTQDQTNTQRITLGEVANELMNQTAGSAKPTRDHLEKGIVQLKHQKDDAMAAKSLAESERDIALRERDTARAEIDRLRKNQAGQTAKPTVVSDTNDETLVEIFKALIDIQDGIHFIGTAISEDVEEQLRELAMLHKARVKEAAERRGIVPDSLDREEQIEMQNLILPEEMEQQKESISEELER